MLTDVSEASVASNIKAMSEPCAKRYLAARTSETSFEICLTTRQYMPEYSKLHTRRRENLKSHIS
jgi:hypothetical protein